MPNAMPPAPLTEEIVAATRAWLEKAVIGLNLCPFAKAVYVRDQIRYVVCETNQEETLLDELERELRFLDEADPEVIDTTLIIHPRVLDDFLDYNDFLDLAEGSLKRLELEGVIQIASFHPDYQFAGTEPDDVTNYTNRSPFPMLHLLREESLDRALASFPEPESIYQKNMRTLRRLGREGWEELMGEKGGDGG